MNKIKRVHLHQVPEVWILMRRILRTQTRRRALEHIAEMETATDAVGGKMNEAKKMWWKKSRQGIIHKLAVMLGIRKSPTLEYWMKYGVPKEAKPSAGQMNLYRGMR